MKTYRRQTARKSTNPKFDVQKKLKKIEPKSFQQPFVKQRQFEIDFKSFGFIVEEILDEMKIDLNFQMKSISILQEAAENYIIDIFENINQETMGNRFRYIDFWRVNEPVDNIEPTAVLSSYKTFFIASNRSDEVDLKIIDDDVERLFLVFWGNKAYDKAIDLLSSLDQGVPSKHVLVVLFQFMNESKQTNDIIYDYILNTIINYPPNNEATILYYKSIFSELATKSLQNVHYLNKKGVIDTLYLASIHDYLSMNFHFSNTKDSYRNFNKINGDYSETLKTILKSSKSIPIKSWQRLYEIISFCDQSFGEGVNKSSRYFLTIKFFMEECKIQKFSCFEEFYKYFQ